MVEVDRKAIWSFWRRYTIFNADNRPRLTVYKFLSTQWFSLKIHLIHTADPRNEFHNHRRGFISFLLCGAYREENLNSWLLKRIRWINVKRARNLHRIESISRPGGVWTLVLCGPVRLKSFAFVYGADPAPEPG